MALYITLGLISRPAKMLSLAQHPDYAQHLSVYAVSGTVTKKSTCPTQSFSCLKNLIKITKTRE